MYQGHHFNSFVGSVRERERLGHAEHLRAVQEAHRTPLPAPTPAGELFARWEASRASPFPPESLRESRSARVSTAQSRASTARSRTSMVASSRGPHSARVASRLASAQRELDGLHELQQARETIKQLRGELGLLGVEENGATGDSGRGDDVAEVPGTPRRGLLGSPAKRRPFPPTDIFPSGTGGEDIIWYRASEFKPDSQRGPRVGGRRQPLATGWRG
jgi:hypothetical protein